MPGELSSRVPNSLSAMLLVAVFPAQSVSRMTHRSGIRIQSMSFKPVHDVSPSLGGDLDVAGVGSEHRVLVLPAVVLVALPGQGLRADPRGVTRCPRQEVVGLPVLPPRVCRVQAAVVGDDL